MRSIGPYTIEGELGRGATAVVLRARGPRGPVALKLAFEGQASTPAGRRQRAELEALRRLDHPNLVRFIDVGSCDGRAFLVMELVSGGTLADRLKRAGPLDERQAATMVRDLARAVDHAHRQSVIHRDIKPDNVLLDAVGRPRLTDFGLARDATAPSSSLTRTGQFLGSPGYWSPEQARGDHRRVGPGADVYGLGATLYALLTGEPPTSQESLPAAVLAAEAGRIVAPARRRPGLEPALEAIVLRCLAPTPEERYVTANALAQALDGWLRSRDGPRLEGRSRPGGRRRRDAAAVALVAAAAGAVGLVALAPRGPGTTPGPAAEAGRPPAASLAAAALARAEEIAGRDPAAALAAVEAGLEGAPTPAEACRLLVARAQALMLLGRRDDALAALDRARRSAPDDGAALARLAEVLLVVFGRPDEAAATLERAEALEPGRSDVATGLAMVRYLDGDHEGSAALAREAIARDEQDPKAWAVLGFSLVALRRYAEARQACDRSLALVQTIHLVWSQRGFCRLALGDPAGALEDLDRALALAPHDAKALLQRARALATLERLDEAAAAYERYLGVAPGSAPALRSLAELRLLLDRPGDALGPAERATELAPDDPTVHQIRGKVLLALGRTAEAREAGLTVQRLLRDRPDLVDELLRIDRRLSGQAR